MVQKLMFYTVNTGIITACVCNSFVHSKSKRARFQCVLRHDPLCGKLSTLSKLRERHSAVHLVQLCNTQSSVRRHG